MQTACAFGAGELRCDIPMKFPLQDLSLDMYRRNPFRLLGLTSTVRKREVTRQLNALLPAIELDDTELLRKTVVGKFDSELPTEHSLRNAAKVLEDPFRRLLDELFWFRCSENSDASDCLADDSPERFIAAVHAWLNAENDTDLVAMHNVAVFHHLMALEIDKAVAKGHDDKGILQALRDEADYCWVHALKRWCSLLQQDAFWQWLRTRSDSIGKQRIDEGAIDELRNELPIAILALNARLTLSAASRNEFVDLERHRRLTTTTGFSPAQAERAILNAAEPIQAQLRERIELFDKQRHSLAKTELDPRLESCLMMQSRF
jgi:hypothetical protein